MSTRPNSGSLLKVATVCLACCAFVQAANAQSDHNSQEADARVRRALEYEVEGQSDFRNIMLRAALGIDPQHVAANWFSGRIRKDDRWLTIAEAQQRARGNEVLAKYRELRNAAYGDLRRQVHLARWCARFGLAERSQLHFALLLNPSVDERTRQEALRRLDLHEVGGRLMSDEQLKDHQTATAKMKKAMNLWQPQLIKWRKVIEGKNGDKSAFAIEQMLAVDDPSIVSVLESFLPVSGNRFGVQLVRLLDIFSDHQATKSLARFAVFSPWPEVRKGAIVALKSRPLHEYAPLVLAWLTSPVNSKWRLYRDRQGNIHYEHLVSREGANENQLLAVERVGVGVDRITDSQFVTEPTNGLPTFFSPVDEFAAVQQGRLQPGEPVNHAIPIGVRRDDSGQEAIMAAGMLAQAMGRETQFRNYNAWISLANSQVFYVLEQTTGAAVARDPVDWWTWWDHYNEIHKPTKRTQIAMDRKTSLVTRSVGTQMYTHRTGPVISAIFCSCFVAGTTVWTETGLTSIEDIQVGDRVLSQDPESGELVFKLVTGKTLRPPAPLTRIAITGEEILTTKGHPMWVVNKGWRMAKFIEEGQELHGIEGGVMVHEVELLKREEEAHNLVVADFSTYFVGKMGVLVHDNTYRKPTRALVPGLVKE